jgi:hypothetical protein
VGLQPWKERPEARAKQAMRRKPDQPGPILVRGASFLSAVIFIVVVYLALILHRAMLDNYLKQDSSDASTCAKLWIKKSNQLRQTSSATCGKQ